MVRDWKCWISDNNLQESCQRSRSSKHSMLICWSDRLSRTFSPPPTSERTELEAKIYFEKSNHQITTAMRDFSVVGGH